MKTTDEAKSVGYELTEHIEYTRTIVPSSMRSPYWKYFGFPANDENSILTRQKIICTLCNTAIAYNKNTSNLRTHLIARHQNVLLQMQFQHSRDGDGGGGGAAISDDPNTTVATTLRPATTTTLKRPLEAAGVALPPPMRLKLSNLSFTTPTATAKADDAVDEEDIFMATDFKDVLEEDDDALVELAEPADGQDPPQLTLDDGNVVELIDPAAAPTQLSVSDAAAHFDDDLVQHDEEEDEREEGEEDEDDERVTTEDAESMGLLVAQPYTFVDIVTPPTTAASLEQHQQQQQQLENSNTQLSSSLIALENQNSDEQAIIEMLITDLLPIGTVCGRGFQQLLMCAPLDRRLLEAKICAQHAQMQRNIGAQLAEISHKSPYSLSIECYKNLEHTDICDLYFNYVSNDVAVAPELHSVLYHSTRCSDVDLTDLLQHLNLEHCAVIVVSGEAPPGTLFIEAFVSAHEIPTIQCLESVLTRCLVQIFSVSAISVAFEEIYKLSEEVLLLPAVPEVYANCPWSKLNYLQFVLDNFICNGLNDVALNDDIRNLVEYLQPLKITLDTIAEEPLPICSLIRPLVVRLYEEHFAVAATSCSYLTEARTIIETEFQKCIIHNNFLNEATFFDARFRHDFIDAEHSSCLQQEICARFKRLLVLTKVPKPLIKTEPDCGGNLAGGKRKSSLKMFFARINDASASGHSGSAHTPSPQKTTIDLEFDKYKCESTLDLEQCPISWWRQQPTNATAAGIVKYQQLSKLAAYYLCVPACANRLYRSGADANERWVWRQKRAALRQQQQGTTAAERCLWYMHYNRAYCAKLSQADERAID